MADTSERIIILSFLILLFIASQSNGTRESTRLEISTDKSEYIIGERVKSTFYIFNPNPFQIKVEPYNIFEIDVFLNNIPQDGALTAHSLWESGAMITIPPESRHKIDDMTFVANEAGNLTINLNIRIKNDLAGSARHTVLILDPDKEAPIPSLDISDLLDPEYALSQGFKGYIDISYVPKIPDRVNVTSEKMINYTIQLELISHVPEFTETEVVLEPENARAHIGNLQSDPDVKINDYIRYSPNGTIILKVNEPRNVTMILSVPEGLPTISEYPGNLIGVGIFADVPIASAYGAGIRRIESARTRTLKEIDVEIYIPLQNYTLGENFTAIVYFVNNESVEVWIEAVSHYTINSFSLSHPEEALSADVHDTIDSENPWIHIPANSRIEFDYMFCKPQYTGEFRISCLGAEKTVLILEPKIQPYENTTSSNETITSSGPLGDLTKHNLTMNCDLPPTLEYIPRLKMERVPITNSAAEEIALNAFNFSDIKNIEWTSMGELAVIEGNKRLYFHGLNDIYYQTLSDKTVVEDWSEPEIRAIADEFLENLYKYWQVPTEAHIEFNTIRPSSVTIHKDGTEDVNKIGAKYSVKVAGIKLYGPGADFGLSIADGKVYDVELHIPSVYIEEYTDLPLSPQEALDRFLTGNYSIEELGFTTMYGAIPREGQLIIEKVELVYFIDHHRDPPQTYPPLCYLISGTIIGSDPFGDEIISIDFHELIPVT